MKPYRRRKDSGRFSLDSSWQQLETLESRLLLSAALEVIADYAGSYANLADANAGVNPLGILDFTDPANRNPNYVHKINLEVQTSDFAAGQDLALIGFDISLGSHLTTPKASPWTPVSGVYDSDNDGVIDTPFFQNNIDGGSSGTDLKGILIFISAFTANNRQYGETPRPKEGGPDTLGYPTIVGSVLVQWDGTPTMLLVEPTSPSGSNWTTFDNNSNGTDNQMTAHTGALTTRGAGFLTGYMSVHAPAQPTTEGDSGASNMTFNVSLTSTLAEDMTFTFATSDGTAVAGSDYQAVNQTVTIPAGQSGIDVTVPIIGDLGQENTETFSVRISNATGAVIDVAQATGTILDNDPPPSLSVADTSRAEGNAGTTAFTFTVGLSAASIHTVTLDYATSPGTAQAGTDYQTTTGSLTFDPGQTYTTVTVQVYGDTGDEPDETFSLALSNAQNATIARSTATAAIVNDDPPPSMSVADISQAEGNSGTAAFTFTVSLSIASGKTVTVDYATSPGSADAGTDYQTTTGTLTFDPGQTSKTVDVQVNGDTVPEGNETFSLVLSNPQNATIANSATATIVNDDNPPPDSFEPDDTAQAASTITPDGAGQAHTISSPTDVDWVKFTLTTAADATIITSGTAGNTRMWLYSESDQVNDLASSTVVGSGTFAQLSQVLAKGTYYVKIDDSGAGGVLADYTLGVTTSPMNTQVFGGSTRAVATFTDANNVAVKVYLKGAGDGEVWLATDSLGNFINGNALRIVTHNTNQKSTLVIATVGRRTATTVYDIEINGSLRLISGKTAGLAGDVTVTGALAKLQMTDTTGQHLLSVGAQVSPRDSLTLVLRNVSDLSVRSGTPIKSITVADWTGAAAFIDAPSLGKLKAKAGGFAPNLNLSGAGVTKTTLGSAAVAGNVTGDWSVFGNIGTISVKGTLLNSTIRTTGRASTVDGRALAGNISSIKLGASSGSDILAGIRGDVSRYPTAADQFTSIATIKSLKIAGWRVPRGQTLPRLVQDSNFSSAVIRSVSLRNAVSLADANVFVDGALAVPIKSMKYVDTLDRTKNWKWRIGQQPLPVNLYEVV